MKSKMRWFLSTTIVIALSTSTFTQSEAHAQGTDPGRAVTGVGRRIR